MVEYVLNVLPRSGQVDAVYVDLAKAFDRVDHKILADKLRAVGISGSLLCWLESYLTGRTQKVRIDGLWSRAFSVTGRSLGQPPRPTALLHIHQRLMR